MQLLVNYGKMKQAALWAAELVKLSSLQTCVLLSLLMVTSASPPRALRPLSLFLSHISHPSPEVQLCAGCLCPAEQGQHVLWLGLARTQCCSPSRAPWAPLPASPLCLPPDFRHIWGSFSFEIATLCQSWEKRTQRVVTRGTDRQAESGM